MVRTHCKVIISCWLLHSVCFVSSAYASNIASNEVKKSIIKTYSDVAYLVYSDSLTEALQLQRQIRKLVSKPSKQQLDITRQAWLSARIPYSQSEAFRFGNPIVDDWEGRVNAWPLDEGLIDYIVGTPEDAGNWFANANIIANTKIEHSEYKIQAPKIDKGLLENLHSIGDIETNVATGYHAIEFLLWGQDLNGTKAGAGNRPHTDFDRKNCTNGNCFRRGKYLQAAVDLLVKDLTWMVKQWEEPNGDGKYLFIQSNTREVFEIGSARNELLSLPVNQALESILIGMGSLAYGELAGERIKLGLLLNDPEEEQDCFSDNTHNSHFYNLIGIKNIFLGSYQKVDGSKFVGTGLKFLLEKEKPEIVKLVNEKLTGSISGANLLVVSAEQKGVYYDQLLAEGNVDGHQLLNGLIDSLLVLSKSLNEFARDAGLNGVIFQGSEALQAKDQSVYFQ